MKNFKPLFSLVIACALSISMAYGQEDVFTEGFAGTPAGWTVTNSFFSGTNHGLYDGAKSAKLNSDKATSITTSVYSFAGQLSYYFLPKKDDNTDATIIIQKSIDGGSTWIDVHTTTVTAEQAAEPSLWYKDSCDINEASVIIKVTSVPISPMYIDDMRLTKSTISTDNTDLDSILINDGFTIGTIGQTDYVLDLYYVPEVVVGGTAVNVAATVSVEQAADIFSDTEADRTAVITVKSEDETVTTTYNVLLNINADTIVYESFTSTTLFDFYGSSAQFINSTPTDGQNTLPEGDASYSFLTNSILEIYAVEKVGTLSFNAALRKKSTGGNFDIKLYQYNGGDSTLLETLSVENSGLDTAQWKAFSFDINTQAATSFKFISMQTGDHKSRIYVDDITITKAETSGLSSSKALAGVEIYPNPAQEILFVSGISGDFGVSIFNLNGALVMKTANTSRIDISAVSAGAYFVRVDANQASSVQKLIVK